MKKKILTICLLGVMALSAIGGTLAYFTDTGEATNTFTLGKVDIDFDEPNAEEEEEDDDDKPGVDFDEPIVPGKEFPKDPTITVKSDSNNAYLFLDMTFNKRDAFIHLVALDANAAEEVEFKKYDDFATTDTDGKVTFDGRAFLTALTSDPEMYRGIIDRWFVGIEHSKWQLCDIFFDGTEDGVNDDITFRFAYIDGKADTTNKYLVNSTKDSDSIVFMTKFMMPATVTQEQLGTSGFTADEGDKFKLTFKAYAIQADGLINDDNDDNDDTTPAPTTEDYFKAAYKAMFNTEFTTTGYDTGELNNLIKPIVTPTP